MARAELRLVLLVALVLLVPIVQAQGSVSITEIRLLDNEGRELRIAPLDEFITFEIDVNNTGSSTIEGPLTMNFTIESVDGGFTRNANLNRPGPLNAGNTTTFSYTWAPAGRELGDHRAVARMTSPASAQGLVASFTVAETGVATGNIVERTLSFYWVFGLFLIAIIVFFVVLAARRS